MESEEKEIQNEVEQVENIQPQVQVQQPNSMVTPETKPIEPLITNEQLNQIISKIETISNQQQAIFTQMQKSESPKEVVDDGLKY